MNKPTITYNLLGTLLTSALAYFTQSDLLALLALAWFLTTFLWASRP